ncbi:MULTISPECIES: tyrosine-type recombinase/integrase [unclassified Yoonia]|uniref:tyrosine-type recombinase/integrase n=1 Tax=unclassified Yoonia TaxID=2629118 RepID=UPI002AFF368E|nr:MULTISPECIES: tyrosine-type recombinase/integrase [unclassified Yoonia]
MGKTSNKLSSTDIKNLAIGQSAYGSNLRAARNKSGITFYACFTIDGERYMHRLSKNTQLNFTDAIRVAAEYRAKMEREHELKRDGGVESDMTLNEAVPMYMDYLHRYTAKHTRFKEGHFRNHILPVLGDLKIRQINSHKMQDFLGTVLQKGVQPATVNRIKASLDAFYKYGVGQSWVQRKPYSVESLTEEPKRKYRIPEDHQKAMLAAAQEPDQNPLIYLFLVIGFGVGMRHTEILNIRWENIDWETGNIWMPQTKTGAREQATTELIMEELSKLKLRTGAEHGFVFASKKSTTGRIDRMHKAFSRVCKAAGVPETYTPHFMRHTCVSELVAEGCPNDLVMHFTGHKTAKMVSYYAHMKGTKAVSDVRTRRGRNVVADSSSC